MATAPEMDFQYVHNHKMTLHRSTGAGNNRSCDICGHPVSMGWYCSCTPCNFDAHILCAAVVGLYSRSAANSFQFEHVHSQHRMSRIYQRPGTSHNRVCNICGLRIASGSYYSCAPCDFDAHLVCTFMGNYNPPDQHTSGPATKQFERVHPHRMTLLQITNGNRQCDVCGRLISSGQYYQCAPCGFDAHFLCAINGNFDLNSLSPPATAAGTRSVQHMRGPARAPNTSAETTRRSGVETYNQVASAVANTGSAGYYGTRFADFVSQETTGEGIFDHMRSAFESGSAANTSGGGFDWGDIFDCVIS